MSAGDGPHYQPPAPLLPDQRPPTRDTGRDPLRPFTAASASRPFTPTWADQAFDAARREYWGARPQSGASTRYGGPSGLSRGGESGLDLGGLPPAEPSSSGGTEPEPEEPEPGEQYIPPVGLAAVAGALCLATHVEVTEYVYVPDVQASSADFEDGNYVGWIQIYVCPTEQGALEYCINGEVQPPRTKVEFDGKDVLRFPPTILAGQWRSGVLKLPADRRVPLLGAIRVLANRAGCEHNIPLSVLQLPETEIGNPIRELRDKLVSTRLYRALEEFDGEVKQHTLVIDRFSADNALEMRRRRLAELEKRDREENLAHEKRLRRMEEFERRALERVNDEADRAWLVEQTRLKEAQRRAAITEANIAEYFGASAGKVGDFVKTRQSQILNKYGELTTTSSKQFEMDKIDWDAIPQQVEIHITSVRGVKNKIPKGEYMVVVSKLDQLGGTAQKWSQRALDGKFPPMCPLHDPGDPKDQAARLDCEICNGWIGGTASRAHLCRYDDVEIAFDTSVHTILPPRKDIKPYNVFTFELVRLPKGADLQDTDSPLSRPLTVGWGVFPVVDGFFRVIKGKYKTALARGALDMHVEHFKTFEDNIKNNIEHWLGNLYFEVLPWARKCDGLGEFDIEAEHNAKYLGLDPERYGEPTQLDWAVTKERKGASMDDLTQLLKDGEGAAEDLAAPAHVQRENQRRPAAKRDISEQELENKSKAREPPPKAGTRSFARTLANLKYMGSRANLAKIEKKQAEVVEVKEEEVLSPMHAEEPDKRPSADSADPFTSSSPMGRSQSIFGARGLGGFGSGGARQSLGIASMAKMMVAGVKARGSTGAKGSVDDSGDTPEPSRPSSAGWGALRAARPGPIAVTSPKEGGLEDSRPSSAGWGALRAQRAGPRGSIAVTSPKEGGLEDSRPSSAGWGALRAGARPASRQSIAVTSPKEAGPEGAQRPSSAGWGALRAGARPASRQSVSAGGMGGSTLGASRTSVSALGTSMQFLSRAKAGGGGAGEAAPGFFGAAGVRPATPMPGTEETPQAPTRTGTFRRTGGLGGLRPGTAEEGGGMTRKTSFAAGGGMPLLRRKSSFATGGLDVSGEETSPVKRAGSMFRSSMRRQSAFGSPKADGVGRTRASFAAVGAVSALSKRNSGGAGRSARVSSAEDEQEDSPLRRQAEGAGPRTRASFAAVGAVSALSKRTSSGAGRSARVTGVEDEQEDGPVSSPKPEGGAGPRASFAAVGAISALAKRNSGGARRARFGGEDESGGDASPKSEGSPGISSPGLAAAGVMRRKRSRVGFAGADEQDAGSPAGSPSQGPGRDAAGDAMSPMGRAKPAVGFAAFGDVPFADVDDLDERTPSNPATRLSPGAEPTGGMGERRLSALGGMGERRLSAMGGMGGRRASAMGGLGGRRASALVGAAGAASPPPTGPGFRERVASKMRRASQMRPKTPFPDEDDEPGTLGGSPARGASMRRASAAHGALGSPELGSPARLGRAGSMMRRASAARGALAGAEPGSPAKLGRAASMMRRASAAQGALSSEEPGSPARLGRAGSMMRRASAAQGALVSAEPGSTAKLGRAASMMRRASAAPGAEPDSAGPPRLGRAASMMRRASAAQGALVPAPDELGSPVKLGRAASMVRRGSNVAGALGPRASAVGPGLDPRPSMAGGMLAPRGSVAAGMLGAKRGSVMRRGSNFLGPQGVGMEEEDDGLGPVAATSALGRGVSSVKVWGKGPKQPEPEPEAEEESDKTDDHDSNDADSAVDSDNELLGDRRDGEVWAEEEGAALFTVIDVNEDGVLDNEEIMEFLNQYPDLKQRLGVTDYEEFWKRLDVNQDGAVDRDEFASLWAAQCSGAAELFETQGVIRRRLSDIAAMRKADAGATGKAEATGAAQAQSAALARRGTVRIQFGQEAAETGQTGLAILDQIRQDLKDAKKRKRRKILVERGERWAAYTTKILSEASVQSGDSVWAIQLQYCWRAIRDELSLRSWRAPRFWFIQVVFLISLYAQLYIHGIGQYLAVKALGLPTSDISPVVYGLLVEYDNNHTYALQELFIVFWSQVMNLVLVLVIVGTAVAFKVVFNSTPQQCSKFVYCLSIANYIFPFLHVFVDAEIDPRTDLAGEPRRHSDILRLMDFYEKNKYQPFIGVVTFFVIYLNIGMLLAVVNYTFTMRIHLNGILQDCYWRINKADDVSFFTPHDLECSMRELEWIAMKAEMWRGVDGSRRKAMISLLITTDEDDEDYIDKQMHICFYQLSPPKETADGTFMQERKVWREFYVLNDGAVIEARKNRTPIAVNLVTGMQSVEAINEMAQKATTAGYKKKPEIEAGAEQPVKEGEEKKRRRSSTRVEEVKQEGGLKAMATVSNFVRRMSRKPPPMPEEG